MIRFTCECGKQLQAREENAGKPVLCPACNRQLTVPTGGTEAIQVADEAVQPAPSRRPPRLVAEDDFEDEPIPAGPTGTSGKAIGSLILGILSVFCNVVTGIPAVILGILALKDISRSRDRLVGKGMAITGIVIACLAIPLSCFGLLMPSTSKVRQAAARSVSQNNLKQMGLAMHEYHSTYERFPPAGFGSAVPFVFQPLPPDAKPLLSWRVAILPFIEQQALYQRFKLDESWDGPNNIKLLPLMPKIYQIPGDDKTPSDHTRYQVFVGNGAAFEKNAGLRMTEITDGISNTVLIVEAAQAVPWTKPEDIPFDPGKPIAPLLSTHFSAGCNCLLGDGSVRTLSAKTPEPTLKAAITRNGGEDLPRDW